MSGTMSGLAGLGALSHECNYGLGSPYAFEQRLGEVGAQVEEVYDGLCKKPTEEVQEFLNLNKKHYSLLNEFLKGVFTLKPTRTSINITVAEKVLEERIVENTA